MTSQTIDRIKADLMERIEKEMEQAGISQGEVARRTGLIRTNVNLLMNKKLPASIEMLVRIAEAVGLTVELKIKRMKD